MPGRGVIFEFVRRGNIVRVAAVDEATGVEAWIIGPVSASQADLKTLARRKLDYVMKKKGLGRSD
ncbi:MULTISPECIES: DUF6898 family protein [Euryhalocaulis]|uniref:DUF6898 family protein n=1 Tax=Euryhalocaulis TaxID=1712422 RepID=UPI0003A62C76|nr:MULTISPECIES: hypothetical protein [Euryhalocaulis]MBA4802091.1 hypothetical protein [Euryhalocaulis sp.]